jgi:hypothetical protein
LRSVIASAAIILTINSDILKLPPHSDKRARRSHQLILCQRSVATDGYDTPTGELEVGDYVLENGSYSAHYAAKTYTDATSTVEWSDRIVTGLAADPVTGEPAPAGISSTPISPSDESSSSSDASPEVLGASTSTDDIPSQDTSSTSTTDAAPITPSTTSTTTP